jgi:hypothetical protein
MAVVWDTSPCSLVEVDQRFSGAYCLHHQGEVVIFIPQAATTFHLLFRLLPDELSTKASGIYSSVQTNTAVQRNKNLCCEEKPEYLSLN